MKDAGDIELRAAIAVLSSALCEVVKQIVANGAHVREQDVVLMMRQLGS